MQATCGNAKCIRPSHLRLVPGFSPYGAHHKATRLTESDVRDIRKAVANGETQKAVRKRYGISSGAICYIVNRATWKHVKDHPD